MTLYSLFFLFTLTSVLSAAWAGLAPAAVGFGLCLFLIPLFACRVTSEGPLLRLLYALSFVLHLYALVCCVGAIQTGWKAVTLLIGALALALLQVGKPGNLSWRPAIPLFFASLTVCWAPTVGGDFAMPPWLSPGAGKLPCLFSALVCPVAAALLPLRARMNGRRRWLAPVFCLLGGIAAFPAVFFSGVFGSEAALLVALPFCAGAELRLVVYGSSAGAYNENKNAERSTPPSCSSKNVPRAPSASPTSSGRAKRN